MVAEACDCGCTEFDTGGDCRCRRCGRASAPVQGFDTALDPRQIDWTSLIDFSDDGRERGDEI